LRSVYRALYKAQPGGVLTSALRKTEIGVKAYANEQNRDKAALLRFFVTLDSNFPQISCA